MTYGATTTTDELLDGRDLTGFTAVVTGASAGLGVETCRALAAHGASVVAGVRDTAKAEGALAEAGAAGVTIEEVDLASLASVRAFTDRALKAPAAFFQARAALARRFAGREHLIDAIRDLGKVRLSCAHPRTEWRAWCDRGRNRLRRRSRAALTGACVLD